jgi:hypothetical protein
MKSRAPYGARFFVAKGEGEHEARRCRPGANRVRTIGNRSHATYATYRSSFETEADGVFA